MRVVYAIASRLAGGGIGDTAYYAARGLYRQRKLKEVIALGAGQTEIEPSRIAQIWFPSRRLLRIPTNYYNLLKDVRFDHAVAERLDATVDIFHGWNGQCLGSLEKAKANASITVVERASSHITTQMALLDEEYERFGVKARVQLRRMIDRCLAEYALADYITVPSQFAYDSFMQQGVADRKLIHLPFGAELSRFFPGQKSDDVFRVLFVGEVGLQKGVAYLLEAWSRLKLTNAELVLVGPRHPNFKKVLADYRQKADFVMAGRVASPLEYYQQASVFVLPSLQEGSALVTYEAMACGLPSIVTTNTGSPVQDGEDGFVISIRDSDALQEKLLYLYENEDARHEMGRRAIERVKEFTWERYGEALVAAYEGIIQRAQK